MWLQLFFSKLRGRVHPFLIALLTIHGLWTYYDATVTSQRRYRPKRKLIPVTESSPLSPYYPPSLGQEYNGYVRTFSPKPFPCDVLMNRAELISRTGSEQGLLFVKEMGGGSTVAAGITARIADHMAQKKRLVIENRNKNNQPTGNTTAVEVCTARLMPMRARKLQNRSLQKSFLWSIVQEPVERIMHKAHQYACIRNKPKSENLPLGDLQDYVLNLEMQDYGYYFRTMPIQRRINPYQTDEHEKYVKEILDTYDFLGTKERMEESLVVLQFLLGLTTADLLYVQSPYVAKTRKDDPVASQTDFYEQWNKGSCRELPSPKVTLEMKQWFHSEEFEAFVQADVLMYKAINASLDNTIDSIGRDRVEKAVKQLQWAQSLAQDTCQSRVKFPCSPNGKIQLATDCYYSDVGCGYQCLDQVAETLAQNPDFQKLSQ